MTLITKILGTTDAVFWGKLQSERTSPRPHNWGEAQLGALFLVLETKALRTGVLGGILPIKRL